jgi:hypothetical protein
MGITTKPMPRSIIRRTLRAREPEGNLCARPAKPTPNCFQFTAPDPGISLSGLAIPPTVAFRLLCCLAAVLWILYFSALLLESGKMEWVKRRLVDLVILASIAFVTVLVNLLIGLIPTHHR